MSATINKMKLNSLAGFKKIVEYARTNGICMKSTVYNSKGEEVRTTDFAPISITQSNSFALKRGERDAWIEYGKAENWQWLIETGKAKKKYPDGFMILEFNDPSFFEII